MTVSTKALSRYGDYTSREMPASPSDYASALYEMLHRLDAQGLQWIAVERPPDAPEWAGVLDRLLRAGAVRGSQSPATDR